MAMTKDVKETIIARHAKHDGDTGSPEVQIALLTERITTLTEHLKAQEGLPQPSRPAQDGGSAPAAPQLPAGA